MNIKTIWMLIIVQLLCYNAYSKEEGIKKSAPEFKSSIPENNSKNVSLRTDIDVVFNETISLAPNHGITINNVPANVQTSSTMLIFEAELVNNSSYKVVIPKGALVNSFGIPLSEEVQLSFTTKEAYISNGAAIEFVANMGIGWNLGNTLDTKNKDKTKWGNPKATKALIDAIKAKGFKTLRVPVTWQYNMGGAPDYTIEQSYLNRVEEVVKYGLDNDMYVIVNIHHDEEWIIPTYAEVERAKKQLNKVWSQIANHLKDYDEHLIFETLNEPRLKGTQDEWHGGTAEGRDCINQFHKEAVRAIRSTGQNNSTRYIMISTYAASSAQVALDDLVLPSDSNLIASVHNYYPYKFCQAEDDFKTTWGTAEDKQALDDEFNRLVEIFIDKGIPVILGEWGSIHHNNIQERIKHAGYYAKGCISRGICPIWWDNGNSSQFGIINRETYQWIYPEIANVIVSANQEMK
jgi:endoglucanase